MDTSKSVPPRGLAGDDLDCLMAQVEKSQQLAGHFPDAEALDRARRILVGETTLEAALTEIDAQYMPEPIDEERAGQKLAAAEIRARARVERVAWTMGLEGQNLTPETVEDLVQDAVDDELGEL